MMLHDDLFCPRCPDGTRLEDHGTGWWCPVEQEYLPDSEVAEAA